MLEVHIYMHDKYIAYVHIFTLYILLLYIEESKSGDISIDSIEIMAEYFKIKHNLTSVLQMQEFLDSTNEAYSLMTGLFAIHIRICA